MLGWDRVIFIFFQNYYIATRANVYDGLFLFRSLYLIMGMFLVKKNHKIFMKFSQNFCEIMANLREFHENFAKSLSLETHPITRINPTNHGSLFPFIFSFCLVTSLLID